MIRSFKCRPDRDSDSVDFEVEIDWTGVDEETAREIAANHIIVGLQAKVRTSWTDYTDEGFSNGLIKVSALEYAPRGRRISPLEALKKLPKEERRQKLIELGLIEE